MFSFFSKKEYLVDRLSGFIDIHNHILPGIDDGAKTIDDSVDLIKGFKEFGVSNFICTPHIMHNYYDNSPKTIKKAFKQVKKYLKSQDEYKEVKLSYAAEHMIDDNFETILAKEKVLPIRDNHLLIEMSFLQPSINFDIAVEKIKRKGIFPVLAHPERYLFLHDKWHKYLQYKENNIQFQLNLLSLGNYYGNDISKIAHKLLDKDLIDYVASDAHHMNHILGLKKVVLSKKMVNKLEPIINRTIEAFY